MLFDMFQFITAHYNFTYKFNDSKKDYIYVYFGSKGAAWDMLLNGTWMIAVAMAYVQPREDDFKDAF